jgi:hypothetical protein
MSFSYTQVDNPTGTGPFSFKPSYASSSDIMVMGYNGKHWSPLAVASVSDQTVTLSAATDGLLAMRISNNASKVNAAITNGNDGNVVESTDTCGEELRIKLEDPTDPTGSSPLSAEFITLGGIKRRTGGSEAVVTVRTAQDFDNIDSSKVYLIDGIVDLGGMSIEVPSGGLSIMGTTFDVSQLICSEDNYDMFTSPVGGSGNLLLENIGITASGTSSKVFALTDATGFNAIEINKVNFNGCSSLGYLDGYRQGLENGTGRFGGSPELEFRSSWVGGYRTTTTITRGVSNITSLFKAGAGFSYSGRVALEMNCDLPATGAFMDFAETNIANDESLQLLNCRVTRQGVINTGDTTLYPNIDNENVKCLWSNNVGVPNTTKYIKSNITTEVETIIAAANTYYPLLGTLTVEKQSHFSMPSNGEFQLLSGNGTYQITGDLVIDGTANDLIDVRVTQSTDGGSTWPTEVTHIRRQINALAGGRDVAFFPINFIATINEDDRLRLEVENTSGTGNVTVELDSFFIITSV